MPRYDFDLFTIGAGSGGVAGTRRAGAYGARTAICEELRIGGTCVLRGCVPKKLLVYGSQFAEAFADAPGFGWSVPPATHDWGALIEAKDKEIGRLSDIYVRMLNNAKVEIFEARGIVVDPHTVEVGGKRYTAENIMIAVGGWPETPKIPGIEHVISSNEALDLPKRPRRIVIVGGGYIAVEFAGIFAGFGSEVVEIIRADRLLRGFDEDVRGYLGEEMRIRGVDIRGGTQIARIDKTGAGYTVTTTDGKKIETDCVMYATGRAPNTKGLGLAELGVEMTENGAVKVDEWQRSSVKSIYAVGDVTDRINLTPVAIAESRAIAEML
jgi:glutathione reductase (NADPH)